jgi:hypothetical protein
MGIWHLQTGGGNASSSVGIVVSTDRICLLLIITWRDCGLPENVTHKRKSYPESSWQQAHPSRVKVFYRHANAFDDAAIVRSCQMSNLFMSLAVISCAPTKESFLELPRYTFAFTPIAVAFFWNAPPCFRVSQQRFALRFVSPLRKCLSLVFLLLMAPFLWSELYFSFVRGTRSLRRSSSIFSSTPFSSSKFSSISSSESNVMDCMSMISR